MLSDYKKRRLFLAVPTVSIPAKKGNASRLERGVGIVKNSKLKM